MSQSSPKGFIEAMLPAIDAALGVRDAVGAVILPVYLVTRIYYSDSGLTVPNNQPEGYAQDMQKQVLPSPMIVQYKQDLRLREGGAVKAGDIVLKSISKNLYKESDLDGSTPSANIQKLFLIGDKLYQVISVTQKYLTFEVQVRELNDHTRY